MTIKNGTHGETISACFRSETASKIRIIAAKTNDTPAGLIRLLAERYVEAWEKHNRRVIYPPEYRLYSAIEKESDVEIVSIKKASAA